ncbi:hypothetical protein GCM10010524_30440 [Streptomyces mexicanus]
MAVAASGAESSVKVTLGRAASPAGSPVNTVTLFFTVVDRVAVHHADEDRRVPLRTACGSARSVTW